MPRDDVMHSIVRELFPTTVGEVVRNLDDATSNTSSSIEAVTGKEIINIAGGMKLGKSTTASLFSEARLILLLKPGKNPSEPASYRPICLIDNAGKMLERIICMRLERAIATGRDLSPNQFGFRKARSIVVLGPLLWNAMYDSILKLIPPPITHMVGFADDIAVLVVRKELKQAETVCN
ncbi:uncharacterized protein LOC127565803 [Drosophila albomicans]|uniref:Uncharacterized protein LOC127565803 n=1 Tax=Drosophila albomicans TaxID=7291 RepID=A0A9C6SUX3_DROAB|nr:uncharacterized protein LOC127565803 [Drosophila albomicans]